MPAARLTHSQGRSFDTRRSATEKQAGRFTSRSFPPTRTVSTLGRAASSFTPPRRPRSAFDRGRSASSERSHGFNGNGIPISKEVTNGDIGTDTQEGRRPGHDGTARGHSAWSASGDAECRPSATAWSSTRASVSLPRETLTATSSRRSGCLSRSAAAGIPTLGQGWATSGLTGWYCKRCGQLHTLDEGATVGDAAHLKPDPALVREFDTRVRVSLDWSTPEDLEAIQ